MTESGLVVVDKPAGFTSHDVVAKVRRLAQTKKVGHAGTLDPMATGILLLGIEKATRLLGYLQLADKEYLATIRLGASTVTDDAEGDVLAVTLAGHVTEAAIRAELPALTGDIAQVPTAVSAIKVDGVRSYARVRAGEEVELKARPVTVSVFELLAVRHDGDVVDVDVRVVCSSGTYVRALARDLGAALDVGGHLTALRRTRVGPVTLDSALTLEHLEESFRLTPLDDVARASFPSLDITEVQAWQVGFGRPLPDLWIEDAGPHALFAPDGQFLALYERRGPGARPVAVFV